MTTQDSPSKTARSRKSAPAPVSAEDEAAQAAVALLTTIREAVDQITGFEEQVIIDKFDYDVWDAYDEAFGEGGTRAAMRLARMLSFVDRLREGSQPDAAYDSVLAMTSREVDDVLKPKSETADAAGKGESA